MKREYRTYIAPAIEIHAVPAEEGFAVSGGAGGGEYGEFEEWIPLEN